MVKQLQFFRGGVHPLAPDLQFVGVQVDHQAVEGEAAGFGLVPPQAAEDSVDPGQQLLHLKGLDDVVVGPHLQAGDFVGGFAFGGEHDDGGFVGLPNFGADGPAVHHREHDIQQHQVGAEEAVELQGFAAVLGDHGLVTFLFQVEVDELGDVALVLYDEYFPCHGDTSFCGLKIKMGIE